MTATVDRIVYIFAQIYFTLVNVVFYIYNEYFVEKKYVTRPKDPLLFISATKLAKKIVDGEVNPLINAVVEKPFEAALQQAKEIDQRLSILEIGSKERLELLEAQPLLGVPHSLKECFGVKGLLHTSGYHVRKDARATEDSEVLVRLRNAGAILLTTTNIPEGALLGAAGAIFGVGSDHGGSVRIPCNNNGIFVIIPLTNHFPVVPEDSYSAVMGVAGPMARYAEDIETVFKVTGGVEAEKILAKPTVPLNKLRVFYQEGITPAHIRYLSGSMRDALRKTVQHFANEFHINPLQVKFEDADETRDMWIASEQFAGEKPLLNDFLGIEKGEKLNSILELLKYPFTSSVHTLGTLVAATFEEQFDSHGAKKQELVEKRDRLRAQIIELLSEDGVLFFPTAPQSADYHNAPLFKCFEFMYTGLWNVLALPALVCPVGKDSNGLPLTVQVIGVPNNDVLLFKIGKEIERAFGGWELPSA